MGVYGIKVQPDQLIGPTDVQLLINMLHRLETGATIALDTETTGLDVYQDDVLRGVSIAFRLDGEIKSFYIPVGYPYPQSLSEFSQQMIFQAIHDLEPFLVLHHGKFDFAFLRQLPMSKEGGIYFPIPEHWWDTKVVAWLLDENLPTGLKEQAAFHFGEDSKDEQKHVKELIKQRGGWDKLTAEDTAAYAAKDAELTLRLYERQRELFSAPTTLGNPAPAIEREMKVQGVLFRLERQGILVDEGLLIDMTAVAEKRIAEIEGEFSINLKSTLQVGRLLDEMGALPDNHPRTASGKPSMNRAALEGLENTETTHSTLNLILEHRRLQKALTGYLRPLKERIGRDGRVHAGFMSTGTVTGRFSCSRPNLQTIPRADTLPGVRDIFVAEEGFELWEYDLSAAEMRVVAGMASETVLIDSLNEGIDMHGALAADVFGPKYTGLQRRFAKNIGYGWFYGLTSLKTAAKYTKDEGIAEKILNGLKERYGRVYKLMGKTTRKAQKEGYIRIHDTAWPGRFRRFVTQGVRRPAPYTALNAQVQGGIGELMKDVMLELDKSEHFERLGARICLQVHDSLVIEVPEGAGRLVHTLLQEKLAKVNPFDMPMIFDASPWAEHE